ncbi:hypothetical protein SNE40_016163 [Patella caerulea]|uniref:SAM-dependent MTase RsmB/NOP-type domain-containing protein n=2 Tax=Patella caerulea TaxID=87958 RepID=A0AAN8PCS4_PATCE
MSPTTGSNGLTRAGSYIGHHVPAARIQNRGDGHGPMSLSHSTGILLTSENINTKSLKRSRTTNGFFVDFNSELKHRMEFFHKEECFYTHEMYVKAGKIYDALKHESEEVLIAKKRDNSNSNDALNQLAQLDFENDNEKRLTFELSFSTLKYQNLFDEIIDECSFYNLYPELREEDGLVMVTLCEFQERKFQYRSPHPGEIQNPLVQQVERAIMDTKTKLNAALARHRIKASARSLEFLLPDNVRKNDAVKEKMPAYFWVNQIKSSMDEVMNVLKDDGYKCIPNVIDGAHGEDKVFSIDHHCPDLLVFPAHLIRDLLKNRLITEGHLVRQDKSSCLAPHSVKYLLNDDDDVIHVNAGSGLTSAHIASLLKQSKSHIWTFGATSDSEAYNIHKNIEKLDVGKQVRVVSESFLDVEPDDSRFKTARVVLVTAFCSKSAVTNPVEFVVSEGEDMTILKDLSVGEMDETRIGDLMHQHTLILRHAMKFSKVQAVVYMTRSVHEAENENVVQKTVEYVNLIQQRRMPYRLVPPVLPFSADEIENNNGICGKYMKYSPSSFMNGCFVAVITREPEELKETAKDVIARATAKGLLGNKSSKIKTHDGQIEDGTEGVVNGGYPEEKLLRKRSRKAHKRMKGSTSLPVNSSLKPIASSPVQLYVKRSPTRVNAFVSPTRSTDRLHSSISRTSSKHSNAEKLKGPEHVRVVRHPAPFR